MYYVYILVLDEDKKLYTGLGYANNLKLPS